MAVTNESRKAPDRTAGSPLQALTAVALLLPGMVPAPAGAVEDAEFSFQYGRYQEGKRQVSSIDMSNGLAPSLVDVPQNLKPIEADSLLTSIKLAITDRIKFNANFSQDTWAGATPVASAPAIFGANGTARYIEGGAVTGASPLIATPETFFILFDRQSNPLGYDTDSNNPLDWKTFKNNEIAHTMAMASPETRKQGDFSLSYEWDDAAANIGGGISSEADYESRFYNFGGRLDFNRKMTSIDFGASYTNSTTRALSDHHARSYFTWPADSSGAVTGNGFTVSDVREGGTLMERWINGRRQDWGFNLGLSQILNKNAFFKLGGSYTYSQGYLGNPYKGVTTFFIDPNPPLGGLLGPDVLQASVNTFIEQRPVIRNQLNWEARLVQHVAPLDASLNVGYRFFHDDWGIHAHTFDANWIQDFGYGFSITPRVRYYSQSEADFYSPFLVVTDRSQMPTAFSSDHRLSGFGALSGGVTVKKEFAKGVSLEAGFEYYTHQGALKLGGGGEGEYADFDFYSVNALLNVDMSAFGRHSGGHDHHHHAGHGVPAPAGVMFAHMLKQRDEFMVGYRYQYSLTGGNMLHGTKSVSDRAVVAQGCRPDPCYVAPDEMGMHMHMLDLMYAPTDWLTLMLMPQFMDMSMTMQELDGKPPHGSETTTRQGVAVAHTRHEHKTGGVGDTGMYAMFKVHDNPFYNVHLTLGFTAPTGDSGIELRDAHGFKFGFIHYHMQLGSGTWDFKPSLTLTGQKDDWSWGAQVSGTKRLGLNDSGFAFGDELQATAWGGYGFTDWLNASVRGVYTTRGTLRGGYPAGSTEPVGSMDYVDNYGGKFWDVGFGLNAFVPKGNFVGNTLSVEWLQPVVDNVNGFQRERIGALNVTWSYMF